MDAAIWLSEAEAVQAATKALILCPGCGRGFRPDEEHACDPIPSPPPLSPRDERRVREIIRGESRWKARPGGEWVLSVPVEVPALWGAGQEVGWSEGEPFIVVGSDGSGKTVLIWNLVLRQLGIIREPLLGLPVARRKRILYLAQDRPLQSARALRRMIGPIDQATLDAGLAVIDRPLPLIEDDPGLLVRLAEENGADTLYLDSLKDVVREPSDEVSGLAVRRACALCVAAGVEVLVAHHDRKPGHDDRKVLKLGDVYGSRFMSAGAGSVIALNGRSGDPIIDVRQLKQPAAEVGPLKALLNFETGEMSLFEGSDAFGALRAATNGLTAHGLAVILFETDAPDKNLRERARRKLETEVDRGRAVKRPPTTPNSPARYYATVPETLTATLTDELLP